MSAKAIAAAVLADATKNQMGAAFSAQRFHLLQSVEVDILSTAPRSFHPRASPVTAHDGRYYYDGRGSLVPVKEQVSSNGSSSAYSRAPKNLTDFSPRQRAEHETGCV
jgi:hypothetical protein